ncbi:MAG: hypothetical protein ACLTTF_00560 [Oscillospiraceae bacterium]
MWQVISIFLQAAGVLLLLWVLVGWLVLGRDQGGMAVLACLPGRLSGVEPFLRCCLWLRGTGILQMPVLLVDCGLDPAERARLERLARDRAGVICCTEAALSEHLKMEAEKVGGFGTSAGDCGGGGVSESG